MKNESMLSELIRFAALLGSIWIIGKVIGVL